MADTRSNPFENQSYQECMSALALMKADIARMSKHMKNHDRSLERGVVDPGRAEWRERVEIAYDHRMQSLQHCVSRLMKLVLSEGNNDAEKFMVAATVVLWPVQVAYVWEVVNGGSPDLDRRRNCRTGGKG